MNEKNRGTKLDKKYCDLNEIIKRTENSTIENYNLVILTPNSIRIFDGKVTKSEVLNNIRNLCTMYKINTIDLINVIIGENDPILQNGTNIIATNLYEYYILEN